MEPGERLRLLRNTLKTTMRNVSQALGVSTSVYSDWESGNAPIRQPNAMALQLLYGVSWKWIMTGEGPMWVEAWKQGTPRQTLDIPVLVGCPSCGPGGEVQDPGSETVPFSASFIDELLRQSGAGTAGNLYATHVQGDSMAPTILNGDLLLVNNALDLRLAPRNGALYLVRLDGNSGDTRVKRVFWGPGDPTMTLQSDNKKFPWKLVDIDGQRIQDLILGKVCWYGRHLHDASAPQPGEDW